LRGGLRQKNGRYAQILMYKNIGEILILFWQTLRSLHLLGGSGKRALTSCSR